MNSSKLAGMSTTLGLLSLIALSTACVAEPPDEASPEALSEAVQELSSHDSHVGPLVLQQTPLAAETYELLAKSWLQWVMGQPFSTGPITDPTGDQCDLGQSGPVWFLAGTTGGPVSRSCTIPADKALYVPLVNHWAIPQAQFVDTPDKLASFIAFAEDFFPANRKAVCSLTLRLDGEEILANTAQLDKELWVDIFDPFSITLDDDNFAGGPGGEYPAALTAGHYALLLPLTPGDHTLEIGGVLCQGSQNVFFETSAVYDLHVEE